ncbi:MAG TPA: Lrp/AsnC family transcriptional regulator [Acidimicrobiales bacterium]|nr:Lrp/AsnC family transcriptional regulator [Acidimicrobiales bacterium]
MESINIDLLDRRIIHALYVDPRAPFSRLADVLGSSEPTVSRRYRRLFNDRILRVVGQLDPQRLGQYDWAVRIRCVPGSAPTVAAKLAQHPGTSWVQLTSGGTEIFSLIHSREGEQRTPLLLSQLSVGRQVVDYEAYCLLHLFATGLSAPPWPSNLSPAEIAQLLPAARHSPSIDRPKAKLRDSDWTLVQALADDGRASYRQLAARTHWHESTVRRRVEELIASGVLFFDLDLDSDAFGIRSQALLWMSVAPPNLRDIGQALASRPEFAFVAATSGSTNLVAALVCPDGRSLYKYLTDEMTALDGLSHIETAPVMQFVKMHATMALRQP